MSSAVKTVDIAVVGAGTMGSMALWHLSRSTGPDGRKPTVLGIEQYGAVHSNGAYMGESRLFRVAAKEGRLFTPALKAARSLWLELGRLAGRDILIPSGVLHVAPEDHVDLAETRATVLEHDLPHRLLDADDLRRQFPQFHIRAEDAGIFDELAGALRPESAVFAAGREAVAGGAEIWWNTEVAAVEPDGDGVRISTSAGEVRAGTVIVAAGPWTRRLVPEVEDLMVVGNYSLTWFVPTDISLFHPSRFPGFMRDLDDAHAFGAPTIDGFSVKISPHLLLDPADDPARRKTVLSREQLMWMGEQAQKMFPGIDPEPVRWSVHPDGETLDKRPIIDTLADGRIVVAAGMSGNGFKFAPVYGEALAQLALTGESRWQHADFTLEHHRALL